MKAALIGDVHANLPALEAVLADARKRGAERIWNVGDSVGYGAFPDEVVALLRRSGAVSIIGNYDRKALKFEKKSAERKKPKRPEKLLAFKWACENLSAGSRKHLRSLPGEVRLNVAGRRVLLCHGSPDSDDEHLGPETPDARLRELARAAEADVIISGHSHRPFARRALRALFINTGSVGRPDDGDPRACYAILSVTPARLSMRHHRVAYDVQRAVSAIRARGLPEAFAQMLLQGRGLDAVLAPSPSKTRAMPCNRN